MADGRVQELLKEVLKEALAPLESDLDTAVKSLDPLKSEIDGIKSEIDGVLKRLDSLESTMVTVRRALRRQRHSRSL
jgi:chromosome segregation ATPase